MITADATSAWVDLTGAWLGILPIVFAVVVGGIAAALAAAAAADLVREDAKHHGRLVAGCNAATWFVWPLLIVIAAGSVGRNPGAMWNPILESAFGAAMALEAWTGIVYAVHFSSATLQRVKIRTIR